MCLKLVNAYTSGYGRYPLIFYGCEEEAMGLLELFLLAVGLSMDAFAVSVCKGLAMQKVTFRSAAVCGVWFGGFQALMPFIGYLLGALIAGAFAAKLPRKFGWLALGCVVGCAACYVLGTIWFMVLTGLDLPTSLTYCVIPYLPGDVIKIALASLLTIQLDKRMPKI